jgi:hypothetical protein
MEYSILIPYTSFPLEELIGLIIRHGINPLTAQVYKSNLTKQLASVLGRHLDFVRPECPSRFLPPIRACHSAMQQADLMTLSIQNAIDSLFATCCLEIQRRYALTGILGSLRRGADTGQNKKVTSIFLRMFLGGSVLVSVDADGKINPKGEPHAFLFKHLTFVKSGVELAFGDGDHILGKAVRLSDILNLPSQGIYLPSLDDNRVASDPERSGRSHTAEANEAGQTWRGSIPSVLKQGCRMAQLALSIIMRGLNM